MDAQMLSSYNIFRAVLINANKSVSDLIFKLMADNQLQLVIIWNLFKI